MKTVAFANAAAAVTAAVYVVCLVLSIVTPDLLISLSNSWIHAISLESLRTGETVDFGTALWGLVSSSVFAWLVGYGFAYFYNKFAK